MVDHSGIGTHLRGLVEGWRRIDKAPPLVLLGDTDKLPERIGPGNETILPWRAGVYSVAEQFPPWGAIKKAGAMALHTPHYNAPILPGGLPRLVTIHDIIHLVAADHLSTTKKLYARTMLQSAARRASALFTVSDYTRRDLMRVLGIEPHRITITPNAVGNAWQRLSDEEVDRRLAPLNLPERYWLMVGIDKPHKNQRFVVDTLADGWAKQEPWALPLVLAGVDRPPSGSPDHAPVQCLGRIDRDLLVAVTQRATGLVMPSLYEGFGLPVLEAQSLGTPVASSNATSLQEVGGDASTYFAPTDRTALRKALNLIAHEPPDKRADRTDRSRTNVARFHWEATARVVFNAWRGIVRAS